MNREIKFRAWDKHDERMIEFDWFAGLFPHLRISEEAEYNVVSETYEIMQYTGLKDKNGKEIYEGDIVKIIHQESERGGWYSKSNEQGVVYFDKNWGVKFDCRDATQRTADHWKGDQEPGHWSDHAMIREYHYSDCEIIGNIYENPSLLK